MPLTASQMLQNRYRVVGRLGEGGMGAVYRAWDTRLHVSVAVKELVPQPGLDPAMLAQLRGQFEQEAVTLARLSHPHLVRVTDFFEEGGNAYLVMEFLEGESLGDYIARNGPLPEAEVLDWTRQLLDALAYCHDQGIVHRDIKPQNILLRPNGRAVLVDFGLVKLWNPRDPRTQVVVRGMGTPEYAPPEQYDTATGHTDSRSDIYSLGATLYHALTGQAPPTATQRMANPRGFVPPRAINAHISPAIESAILRAMAVDMSERFQTAQSMLEALTQRRPTPTPPPPSAPGPTIPAMPGVYQATRHPQAFPQQSYPQQPTPPPGSYPPAPQPEFPSASAPPKSKRPWGVILMIGVGVLLCLGATGVGAWALFFRDQDTPTATTVAQRGTPSPTPAGAVAPPQSIAVNPQGTGDFATLADAVAIASPGATITLAPGTYTLNVPLAINKPLTLVGAGMDQTVIASSAPEAVLRYTGDGLFEARGITFRHEGEAEADAVYANSGEILFDGCTFTGANRLEGGTSRAGLHLAGDVTGRVENCVASGNALDGFRLTEQARVDLVRNIARDNEQMGIQIRDRSGGEMRENRCTDNASSGISVTGDATPSLISNLVSGNANSGIVYFSNAGGLAQDNTCEQNGLHGISVNDSAQPTLEDNILRANTETGLAYFETSGGTARRNKATDNGLHGIGTNEQSSPTLENNTCTNNTQVGMRLAGESTPTVTGNTVISNTLSGIVVTGSAAPTLAENQVSDNRESGIAYFENGAGVAIGNETVRNGLQGISVNGNAAPTLENNLMAENVQAGLRISDDSRPTVRSNTIYGHPLSGIIVRVNAQPTLEFNTVYDNGESGLIYFGTSGGVARNNSFSTNQLHGIHVKDDATPTLEANTCDYNTEAGIGFFDRAGGVARNNQINNNRWGIYIAATANPSLANNITENNATNIDDRR